MPFAENSSLITGVLEIFGESWLIAVEHTVLIVGKTVLVAVFAR